MEEQRRHVLSLLDTPPTAETMDKFVEACATKDLPPEKRLPCAAAHATRARAFSQTGKAAYRVVAAAAEAQAFGDVSTEISQILRDAQRTIALQGFENSLQKAADCVRKNDCVDVVALADEAARHLADLRSIGGENAATLGSMERRLAPVAIRAKRAGAKAAVRRAAVEAVESIARACLHEGDKSTDARVDCKLSVLRMLKAPSGADFPGVFDDAPHPVKQPNGSYVWNAWVDAQNSFGAKLRTRFACLWCNGRVTVGFR